VQVPQENRLHVPEDRRKGQLVPALGIGQGGRERWTEHRPSIGRA
jgi:hypothetical protein